MKFGWAVVLLVVTGAVLAGQAQGQASIYVQGTASNMQGGPGGNYLYGGSGGVLYDGPSMLKQHAVLSANIQGGLVTNAGERLITAMVGPRLSFPLKRLKVTPFTEFLIGFGRYRDSSAANALNTTDYDFQGGGGIAKQVSSRLDVAVSVNYGQFGAGFPSTNPTLAAQGVEFPRYNPLNYSLGVVYHFVKR